MKGVLFGFLITLMTMGIFVSVGCCGGGAKGMPMMERVPFDALTVRYFDMDMLRATPELRDSMVKLDLEEQGIVAAEALTGIKLDDEHLERLTRVWVASGYEADIFEGQFDLDVIRARLEESKCDQGEYRGIELWNFYEMVWATLTDEFVAVGSEDGVKDCVDVMIGSKKSLRSGGSLRVVMDRLPRELYALTAETSEGESEGVESWGSALSKMDSDDLQVTYIYRFKDEQSAADKIDEIKASLDGNPNWSTLTVDQEKEFVEATAKMGTEDFINSTG